MNKISSKDAAKLLKQAGAAIRLLTKENRGLREKVSAFDREKRAQAIAKQMEEKGLSPDLNFDQKLASLREADLEVTEQAVKLAASQRLTLGSPGEDVQGNSLSSFETYIMTGENPTE